MEGQISLIFQSKNNFVNA